jgi:hypothetical protein
MSKECTTKTVDTATLCVRAPLTPCEPWCEVRDGHPDEMPGDRTCRSEGHSVPLALVDPLRASEGGCYLAAEKVSMRRGPRLREDRSRVLQHGRRRRPSMMSLDEPEARGRQLGRMGR